MSARSLVIQAAGKQKLDTCSGADECSFVCGTDGEVGHMMMIR